MGTGFIMIYARTRITGMFIGMIIMILPTENQTERVSSETVSVRRNANTACSACRQYTYDYDLFKLPDVFSFDTVNYVDRLFIVVLPVVCATRLYLFCS